MFLTLIITSFEAQYYLSTQIMYYASHDNAQ